MRVGLAPATLHAACLLWENNAPAALHAVGGETMAPTRGAYIFLCFCHVGGLVPAALRIAEVEYEFLFLCMLGYAD